MSNLNLPWCNLRLSLASYHLLAGGAGETDMKGFNHAFWHLACPYCASQSGLKLPLCSPDGWLGKGLHPYTQKATVVSSWSGSFYSWLDGHLISNGQVHTFALLLSFANTRLLWCQLTCGPGAAHQNHDHKADLQEYRFFSPLSLSAY